MVYAVRIDKDNQRITLPLRARVNLLDFRNLHILHAPVAHYVHRCVRRSDMSEAVRNITLRFCEWARHFF
jgi:hypothetical protein